MFKLLRYFSITSFFSIAVSAALFGFGYRTIAYRALNETAEAANATMAQSLVNALWGQLGSYLATAEPMSSVQLQSHPAKESVYPAAETQGCTPQSVGYEGRSVVRSS